MTQKEFMDRAYTLYPEGFDFSNAIYKTARDKLEVRCLEHDHPFETTPDLIQSKRMSGCELCIKRNKTLGGRKTAKKRSTSLESFKRRADVKHGTKFRIDASKYSNLSDYVVVACNACQMERSVRAGKFLAWKGCPECDRIAPPVIRVADHELIKRASKRQGENFKVRLIFRDPQISRSIVEMTCKTHSEFSIRKAYGNLATPIKCTICFPESIKFTKEETLIRELSDLHNGRYTYSSISIDSKIVTSVCPIHGEITQSVSGHRAHGCVHCKRLEQEKLFFSNLTEEQNANNDYSNVRINELAFASQQIEYTCTLHNVACVQNAQTHLDGRTACKKCSAQKKSSAQMKRRKENLAQRIERFLSMAKEMWGEGRYVYPNLQEELTTFDSEITIHCTIHETDFSCPGGEHVRNRGVKAEGKGRGCPQCKTDALRTQNRKPFSEVQEAFRKSGLEILSDEGDYINGRRKLKAVCINNHITWPIVGKVLYRRQSCSRCSGSIGEEITRLWFQDYFGVPFIKDRFKPSDGGHQYLELDGYNADLNIAFEYQGIYHSDPKAHRSKEHWIAQLKRDESTRKICHELGIELIEVELFNRNMFKESDIIEKLTLAFKSVGRELQNSSFDTLPKIMNTVVKGTEKIAVLFDIAELHNLTLLSEPVWHGTEHDYYWECNRCNYRFYNSVYRRLHAAHECCPKCSLIKGGETRKRTEALKDRSKTLKKLSRKVQTLGVDLTTKVWQGSGYDKVYEGKCRRCHKIVKPFSYNDVMKKVKLCSCKSTKQLR
ncbi:hypothetical protein [Marinobacter sp. es.048]|uniref:hypothetical protein n=1 Tax=Marinobacter sp. es.048 TaxID=1761795 RepID=UPI000B590DBD|nr:hypothetical protein [Marinobacter sp. es.048]